MDSPLRSERHIALESSGLEAEERTPDICHLPLKVKFLSATMDQEITICSESWVVSQHYADMRQLLYNYGFD